MARPPEHVPAAVGGRCVPWCPACKPTPNLPKGYLPPKPKREPAIYRPMTSDEREMAFALVHCTFPVGSPPKRFARDIAAQANDSEPLISERQAEWLRVLVHRYRRQISPVIVAMRLPVPEQVAEMQAARLKARGQTRADIEARLLQLDVAQGAGTDCAVQDAQRRAGKLRKLEVGHG